MNCFKPFRASDCVKVENVEVSNRKYSNNQETIDAVLNEYPDGQLGYGSIVFGNAGNSFVIDYGVGCDINLVNDTIKHINSILNTFGLRSRKEANHYVDPPVKYLIVKIEDS